MTEWTTPSDFYSQDASKYDQSRFSSTTGKYWSKLNIRTAFEMTGFDNITNKVIVDVGCGTGRFTIPLAKYAKKVYAIDLTESMLNILRRKANMIGLGNKIETINADAKQIDLEPESVDFIISMNMLSHLQHPTDVFSEVGRILKPNGRFLFNYPNLNSLFFLVGQYVNQRSRAIKKDVYTRWFKQREIIELINSAGLTLEEIRGLVLPTNLPFLSLQKIPLFSTSFQNHIIARMCATMFVMTVKH